MTKMKNIAYRLLSDRRGVVAFVTAFLTLFVILPGIGLAIDGGELVSAQQVLQGAVDNAALAGAVAYTASTQQKSAQTAATNNFNSNIGSFPSWIIGATPTAVGATISTPVAGNAVTVTAKAQIKTSALSLVLNTITISATATAVNPSVTVKITSVFDADTEPSDMNAIWAYGVPANTDGTWNYTSIPNVSNAGPNMPSMSSVANNCTQYFQNNVPYQGHKYSYDPNNPSRCYKAGYIGTSSGSTVTVPINATATQPIAFALENMVAGRLGTWENDPSAAIVPNYSSGSDNMMPWGYTNQYNAPAGTINWLFTAYASASPARPPSTNTDNLNKANPKNPQTTYYTKVPPKAVQNKLAADDAYLNQPTPSYDPNDNCTVTVQVNNNPTSLPTSGACFKLGATDPLTKYGNLSCVQMAGNTYTYYWNDMGWMVDNYNISPANNFNNTVDSNGVYYPDVSYSITCPSQNTQVRLVR